MNFSIKKISMALFAAAALTGCTKQKIGPLSDIRPAVPVTVQNAMDYRPEPTVATSKSGGGNIQIILAIPSESGRTIKEITKVAASTTYTQIESTGTTGFYTSGPIAANGTTVTFTTSATEYFSKYPLSPTNPYNSNAELARRFYFLLTLDDGSTIITTPVRVLVLD